MLLSYDGENQKSSCSYIPSTSTTSLRPHFPGQTTAQAIHHDFPTLLNTENN
jgi:hypothetical protein